MWLYKFWYNIDHIWDVCTLKDKSDHIGAIWQEKHEDMRPGCVTVIVIVCQYCATVIVRCKRFRQLGSHLPPYTTVGWYQRYSEMSFHKEMWTIIVALCEIYFDHFVKFGLYTVQCMLKDSFVQFARAKWKKNIGQILSIILQFEQILSTIVLEEVATVG